MAPLCLLQRTTLLPLEGFLNFLFSSHIILRVKWAHLTHFQTLILPTVKPVELLSFLQFHQLFLGAPGDPLWVLTNKSLELQRGHSHSPSLLLWPSAVISSLSLCSWSCWRSLSRKVWANVTFAPVSGTTWLRWLCLWLLLEPCVMETVTNKEANPAFTAPGVMVGMMCWSPRCSYAQCPRGHNALVWI